MKHDFFSKPDRASLAGHLLYDSFDPDGQVFVHRDGSLALSWAVGMKDTETSPPQAVREIADRIADFFKHLPSGAAGQFILAAEKEVTDALGRFRAAGSPGSRLEGLFEAHCAMLEKLSIPYGGTTFTGRTLRLYFTLRVFPTLGTGEEAIRRGYAREKELLLEQAKAVEGFFVQLALPCRRLGAEEVVALLYRMLNPERARMTGQQARGLLVAQPVVERDERHLGQSGREERDRIGQMVDPHVHHGPIAPDLLGSRAGQLQQAGGGQGALVGRHDRTVTGRGGHLEGHGDVHENAILADEERQLQEGKPYADQW